MRKLLLITLTIGFAIPAQADIQAPPGTKYSSSRKLGRAVANILYGVTEIPEQMVRKSETEAAVQDGLMESSMAHVVLSIVSAMVYTNL